MTTFDMQTAVPPRRAVRLDDVDRVDVRGLLGAIVGRWKLISVLAIGLAALLYFVTGFMPSVYSAH
ncbi:MAG: hypothetical protein ACU0CY_02970, partial [Maritimibacter harenae]